MAKQVLTMRVEPELIEWLEGYAKERGVSKQAVSETALLEFRELCKTGVPELVKAARNQARVQAQMASEDQSVGVGDCPKREGELGHEWSPAWDFTDPRSPQPLLRECVHCGKPGREFMAEHGSERAMLFSRLTPPASVKNFGKSK